MDKDDYVGVAEKLKNTAITQNEGFAIHGLQGKPIHENIRFSIHWT